jgi:transcriptional activator of cad operon
MEPRTTARLRIGAWCVDPTSGQISRDGETARLEARPMRVLLCLAEHAGEVVSIDDLLDQAWSGVTVSPDSVYQAVASLRRLLGDDPKQPAYIETVPRLGYRMVATVGPWAPAPIAPSGRGDDGNARRLRRAVPWVLGAVSCLVLAALVLLGRVAIDGKAASRDARPPEKSVAVLPFLDLTEGMNQAPFADGMTVELIDKLSKIPDLRVHAPVPSSSFKGKRSTITDMARMLRVAYVLDGSVRKSGATLRVTARLLRGEDESVVWSDTYDRPVGDVLTIQDDIAGEVTRALRASIQGVRQQGSLP